MTTPTAPAEGARRVTASGTMVGMRSVNAMTGAVWYPHLARSWYRGGGRLSVSSADSGGKLGGALVADDETSLVRVVTGYLEREGSACGRPGTANRPSTWRAAEPDEVEKRRIQRVGRGRLVPPRYGPGIGRGGA
jgi:hypothetical protein